jgi:hypothetical protein
MSIPSAAGSSLALPLLSKADWVTIRDISRA